LSRVRGGFTVLEFLLEGTGEEQARTIHDVIAPEVHGAFLEVVDLVDEAGGRRRALLCARDDRVTFYVLRDPGDEGALPQVERIELRRPRGARVTEILAPRPDSPDAEYVPVTLVAEHYSLPGGRLECDVSEAAEVNVTGLRELLSSWIGRAPPGADSSG
jgi:hypothetical protein